MRIAWAACLAAALVAWAPAAHAFPIGNQEYSARIGFAPDLDAGYPILSGSLEAQSPRASRAMVVLDSTGLGIGGLSRVCWGSPLQCETGSLRLEVSDGGDVALLYPDPVDIGIRSDHSLAFFVDVDEDIDFAGYTAHVGRTLAAVHVGGAMHVSGLAPIPATESPLGLDSRTAAGLAIVDDATSVRVIGGATPHTLQGALLPILFQGNPSMPQFTAGATLTPFDAGANVTLAPASPEAAGAGLDPARLDGFAAQLRESLDQEAGPSEATSPGEAAAHVAPLLGAILSGAMVAPPANGTSSDLLANMTDAFGTITLLRFETLQATALEDGSIDVTGQGPLYIQGGSVVGAPGLIGVLPWWCWLLWLAALGLWVARLVVKPAKENETWDRLSWVGWVAGPLVAIAVVWLWDGQVHKVWGLSLLQGGGGGVGTLFLVLMEVLVGLMVYLAVVLPLSSLLKSGARFANQGRFMGLHRPVAMLLGFLLGATLLLSYTDLFFGILA